MASYFGFLCVASACSAPEPPRTQRRRRDFLESDGLLVCGPQEQRPARATFVPLSGPRQVLTRFLDAPIFLQWTAKHQVVFVRHDRLWQAPFDRNGVLSDSQAIGTDAALYASAARDGTLLFVSGGGLRLRLPDGHEQQLGWPISYTPPVTRATLIRNVRIIDGTGGPVTAPRDILVEQGRIARIAPRNRLSAGSAHVLDAAGRIAIPGLMDLHAHTYRPDLLPGFLYFGVTTVRDQGSSMAPLVAYANDIAAGCCRAHGSATVAFSSTVTGLSMKSRGLSQRRIRNTSSEP